MRFTVSEPIYSVEFPSQVVAMAPALDGAVAALIARGWIRSDMHFQARLCLEEAIMNAIRHGNRSDTRLMVRLELVEDAECCRIVVQDEGSGFSPETVTMPDPHHMGGRGVCLIKHYMDAVTYNQERHCLEMTLRRKTRGRKG